MSSLRVIVNNDRQGGFHWRIVQGDLELRQGAAKMRGETEADTKAAMEDLRA